MVLGWLLLLQALDRTAIGAWGQWAAFSDREPPRCYAITAPLAPGGTDRRGGFASVSFAHGGRQGAIFVRFTVARIASAPVTLAVGERRFALTGDAHAAWSAAPAIDRAVIGALRGGGVLTVATIAATGRPFTERYSLAGAATAIDAASLACLR